MLPNLKQLRRERGISQQRLADALGVSQQSINHYENHNIEPDIGMLIRMADYFETSVDFIIGHTDVRRRIENTTSYQLNADEESVVALYRALRPRERACVTQVMDTFLER